MTTDNPKMDRVAFGGVIHLSGTTAVITVPKSTQMLGFPLGTKVKVIIEKIESED